MAAPPATAAGTSRCDSVKSRARCTSSIAAGRPLVRAAGAFWKLKKRSSSSCVTFTPVPGCGAPGRVPWKIWSMPIDARHWPASALAVPSRTNER